MTFEHFESDFNPLQLVLGLMRESASFLGKSSKLVFLHLAPNTTEPFQIPYVRTLWDLKNPNITYKLNGRIRELILTRIQVCTILANFELWTSETQDDPNVPKWIQIWHGRDLWVLGNNNAYYEFSYTFQILLQLSFDPMERSTKTLGKSMIKTPSVDDTFGSPNAVWPYQILENIMGMHIINQCISLSLVINLCKLIIGCNICMVTFMEIAYGEIALLV